MKSGVSCVVSMLVATATATPEIITLEGITWVRPDSSANTATSNVISSAISEDTSEENTRQRTRLGLYQLLSSSFSLLNYFGLKTDFTDRKEELDEEMSEWRVKCFDFRRQSKQRAKFVTIFVIILQVQNLTRLLFLDSFDQLGLCINLPLNRWILIESIRSTLETLKLIFIDLLTD